MALRADRDKRMDMDAGAEGELEYSSRSRAAGSAPVFENDTEAGDIEESYFAEDLDNDFDALPPEEEQPEEGQEQDDADGAAQTDEYDDEPEEPAPRRGSSGKGRAAAPARRPRQAARKKSKSTQNAKRGKGGRKALSATLTLVVVAALAAVVALGVAGQSMVITGPIGAILAPVQSAVTSVTGFVQSKVNAFTYNEQLERDYNAALQELAAINVRIARYDEVVAENERLRSMMNNYEKYAQYQPMFARVIGKDTGNWFASFTVDKGSTSGVTEGMTVMSADGVVGRVVEVGLNYAKVMAIVDGSSGVAALIERNRDNGVVRGMVDDTTGDDLLQMNYLPDVNDVRVGDTVLTSGLDGFFPKGLPIGTVAQISRQSSGLSQYVVVTPYADFEHIEEVILLKAQ